MKKFFKIIFSTILITLVSAIIIAAGIFVYSNYTVGVNGYEVEILGLPEEFDGYKILQLSDLHSKADVDLIGKIDEHSPDVVVMTGDMISTDDKNFNVFLSYAKEISDGYKTYFIPGNHEQALSVDKYSELISKLEEMGIVILDNNFVELKYGDKTINLYGMWFNLRYYRDKNDKSTEQYVFTKENMDAILGEPQKGINILLTHNPVYFDAYAKWGADLVLAGHMHGGMINVPFNGGLFSPEKEYYPEYDGGLYKKKGSSMVVSRGLGQHKGFRFLNQPEIVVITLKK